MALSPGPGAAALPTPPDGDLPHGFHVRLETRTRLWGDGSVLIGGAPWRISKLGVAAHDLVRRLRLAGASGLILEADLDLRAARVLLDRGFVVPVVAAAAQPSMTYTIVVPVLDAAANLDQLLTSLGDQDVIVVDDGSRDPDAIRAVAEQHGARLLRHEVNAGPAAARNTGLAQATGDLIAFIDSDCRADPGWPACLAGHFDDPRVAMVAPRVEPSAESAGLIERYETTRSSLDMGNRAELVRKGGRLGFLPSAAVLVRKAALQGGGFDTALRVGEDVDLTWRLALRPFGARQTSNEDESDRLACPSLRVRNVGGCAGSAPPGQPRPRAGFGLECGSARTSRDWPGSHRRTRDVCGSRGPMAADQVTARLTRSVGPDRDPRAHG
jgi:hypothetical protein